MKPTYRPILRLTLYALLPALLIAQAPDTLWTRTYGGVDDDWGYSVKQTSDGGFIIGGATHSFGTDRGYLIKTDQYGDTIWTKTYLNPAQSILQTSDEGYIFTGGWIGSVGGQHIYVTRTNSIGDTVWTRQFVPSNYSSRVGEIRPTLDSCYVVVGTATDSIGGIYYFSIFLAKINDFGDTLWTKKYGNYDHWGYSIDATIDSGYIIACTCPSGNGLLKIYSQGDSSWVKFYGGAMSYSVRQTSSTDFIRIAYVGGSNLNIYTVKTDSTGDTIWIKEYGGANYDEGFCIREAVDSNYIIAGYSKSYGNGSQDLYLLKIDQNGDSLWARIYGGDSNDVAEEIEVTSDGGYIVVGYTKSYGAGGNDIWLLRLATDPGVQEHNTAPDRKRNWGATILTGPLLLPDDRHYRVFDITGRQIHILNPAPGIYFIEINGQMKQKIIKIK
jgi:hypothetical protein